YPGIPLDCPERQEMAVVVRSLPPDALAGVFLSFPLSRTELFPRWPLVAYNWTGDFRGSLPWLDEEAQRSEREGRINRAALCLVAVARCRLALGEIAAAEAAYQRGGTFCERLPAGSRTTLVFAGYRLERCVALDEGWNEFISSAANSSTQPSED